MYRIVIALLAVLCTLPGSNLSAQNSWETLPVFYNGRVMPLHTFARKVVREICGTERPLISRDDNAVADLNQILEAQHTRRLDQTRLLKIRDRLLQLVPAEGRHFTADELLFSWISEPEVWAYIPLFRISDREYWNEMFDNVLFDNAAGSFTRTPERRVSVYQLQKSQRFAQRLAEIHRRRHDQSQTARTHSPFDHITERLAVQSQLFDELTFHPERQQPARMISLLYQSRGLTGESSSYMSALEAWSYLLELGEMPNRRTMERSPDHDGLTLFHPTTERWHGIADKMLVLMQIYDTQESSDVSAFPNAAIAEKHFEELIELIDTNFAEAAALMESLYPGVVYQSNGVGYLINIDQLLPRLNSPENRPHQPGIRRIAISYHYSVRKLRQEIESAYLALYDNGLALRFLPMQSSMVLEKGIAENQFGVQPWASAAMILESGDAFIKRFFDPVLEVQTESFITSIRNNFKSIHKAYKTAAGGRYNTADFAAQTLKLQTTLHEAAAQIADRQASYVNVETNRLAEHIAKTAYPNPASWTLRTEYLYDRFRPFQWMCLFALTALLLCTASYALHALRKPLRPSRLNPVLPQRTQRDREEREMTVGDYETSECGFGQPDYTNSLEEWLFIGSAAMLALSMLVALTGGVLRAAVSGWAPVTNMYETVVMTAFAAAVIGIWYALYPLLQPALKQAWDFCKFPQPDQKRQHSTQRTMRGQYVMAVPRLGLTFITFYAIVLLANGDYAAEHGFIAASVNMFATEDVIDWLTVVACVVLMVWFIPIVLSAMVIMPWVLMHPSWIAENEHTGTDGTAWLKQARNAVLNRKMFIMITAFVVFTVGLIAWLNRAEFNPDIRPIAAVLRSNFWLAVHVIAILISYAAAFIAWGMAAVSLGYVIFGKYKRIEHPQNEQPNEQRHKIVLPETCQVFAPVIERLMKVALLLLIVGTVLGARWADYSWGRFWSWDPKEVWALITILFFAIVLHGKIARYYGAVGIFTGALFASIAVIITWYGINFVFSGGRHTYGGGTASNATIVLWSFITVNLLWGTLALLRYSITAVQCTDPLR